ncbi:unnamed protein product, partial [Brassica rapa subsp. narinosa]
SCSYSSPSLTVLYQPICPCLPSYELLSWLSWKGLLL